MLRCLDDTRATKQLSRPIGPERVSKDKLKEIVVRQRRNSAEMIE